jgi:spore germination cell wall hydrolase CwlJ-like protein
MERNFLSQSLFAIFAWSAIVVSVLPNKETLSRDLNTYVSSVNTISESINKKVDLFMSYGEMLNTANTALVVSQKPSPKPIPKNDLQCMAENIFYEAAMESYAGKLAVGHVVLNRVKSRGYPSTICGVIYDGSQYGSCQFSWICNESRKSIDKSSKNWQESLKAAENLLNNKNSIDFTEGATSYHAEYVKPDWSKTLKFVAKIDKHLFYVPRNFTS